MTDPRQQLGVTCDEDTSSLFISNRYVYVKVRTKRGTRGCVWVDSTSPNKLGPLIGSEMVTLRLLLLLLLRLLAWLLLLLLLLLLLHAVG